MCERLQIRILRVCRCCLWLAGPPERATGSDRKDPDFRTVDERSAVLIDTLGPPRLDSSDLDPDFLGPLLAGLREVLPWEAQWHPDTAGDHAAFLRECTCWASS